MERRHTSQRGRLDWSFAAALAIAFVAAGCAPPPEPMIQMGPGAEVTFDGLHRVDHARVGLAFMKPDANLAQYDRFMLEPVEISYKRSMDNHRLSDPQTARLKQLFREVFTEALGRDGGYPLVEQAGPGVLRIRAAIIDLKLLVDPNAVASPTRTTVYTTDWGEMTLVMELRDSVSGEILARGADRRRGRTVQSARFSTVTATAEMRRLFGQWASLLRERLDAFHKGSAA